MFKNLIISGGAFNALMFIGAIKRLEETSHLDTIKTCIGSSAGSIICLCLVLGYSANDMETFIKAYSKTEQPNVSSLNIDEIMECIMHYGINDGSKLEELFSNIIYDKLQMYDVTFMELTKHTNRDLVVCGANVSAGCPEFFSVHSHPHMSVSLALRISCGIPLLFTPILYQNCYYVDAGLYSNFPLEYLQSYEDTLGLNVHHDLKNKPISNFFDYIYRMLCTAINRHNDIERAKLPYVVNMDVVPTKASHTMNILCLQIEDDYIQECIKKGYDIMDVYLLKQQAF